jgi:hypothetical protein
MVTTIVHSSFPAAHSTGATHYKQLVAVGVLWQRPRIGPVMRSKHRPYGAVRQRSALSALITAASTALRAARASSTMVGSV